MKGKGEGLVHLYSGDGKGKTTAAMGLALRALGAGKRVAVCQFLKDGTSGELAPLQKLGVVIYAPNNGGKFLWQMSETERTEYGKAQAEILRRAEELAESCDLLVLDEAAAAAGCGVLEEKALLEFVAARPEGLELVLTGRDAPAALLEAADYVTIMACEKHPYEKGVRARKGIEF